MMARKVVYNGCYGGFTLSKDAVLRAREISGDPKWGDAVLQGEMYSDGSGPKDSRFIDYGIHIDGVPRHDEVLVRVVEEMGEKASGKMSKVLIDEVEGPYRIDEYDGFETVMTRERYDWVE